MTDWPSPESSDFAQPDDALGIALSEDTIDEVAALIDEFGLAHVELNYPSFRIAFGKTPPSAAGPAPVQVSAVLGGESVEIEDEAEDEAPVGAVMAGLPVSSPMTGIFYSRANPGSPPFAAVGDSVIAGQVVCLIEAMKVFNEITAPVNGTIGQVGPKDGDVVQPGDMLVTVLP